MDAYEFLGSLSAEEYAELMAEVNKPIEPAQ